MKILTLIIAILFSGMLMQAQIKSIDFSEAIEVTKSTPPEDMYNQLSTYDSCYVILYKSNTIGVVHSHRKILSILEANNLDFDKPDYDNSYLASDVDGYNDYEAIPFSVKMGKSVIMKRWEINGYVLAWILDEEGFGIIIVPIKE